MAVEPTRIDAREDRRRNARRSLDLIAAIILVFGSIDALMIGRFPWESLTVRALWACGVLIIARTYPLEEEGVVRAARTTVWVSVPALTAIVWLTGGLESVVFVAFPAVPLVAVLFADPRSAVLTTVLCVIAVGLVLWLEGAGLRTSASWLILTAGFGTLAAAGGRYVERMRTAALDAERARAEAERQRAEVAQKLAISERRTAEAERLALVGSLASGVAHEINNPLAFIKANAIYLQEQLLAALGGETREAFADINVGLGRIEQIVRDLRSFSRDSNDRMSPAKVRELVEEAVRIASVRMRSAGTVTVDIPDGIPELITSQGRVVQILVNLLVNAADALQGATARIDDPQVRITAEPTADGVAVIVEDNGPGIAEEVLPKLFQPFFTTKPVGKGTGLGLALSREYCARLGGTLVVEKRPDGARGARFVVRLPWVAPEHTERSGAAGPLPT